MHFHYRCKEMTKIKMPVPTCLKGGISQNLMPETTGSKAMRALCCRRAFRISRPRLPEMVNIVSRKLRAERGRMSVRQIQNLMPQQSTADSSLIHCLMDHGHLFPLVIYLEQRDSHLQRLLKVSGQILSLYSLAQDTLLLEPCAKSLCQLVPGSYVNLRHSLLGNYNELQWGQH